MVSHIAFVGAGYSTFALDTMAVAHRRLEQLFCIAYAAGKEFARGMVVKIGVLLGDDIGGEVVPE